MDSLITTFHIDWKILIAQAVNFTVIFLLLYFFALKPLKKIMSERTSIIEKGLADAKHSAEMIENTRKEYENTLAQGRKEAQDIFQQGKKEAENRKAEMIATAQTEVENMIATGKKNLESEKNKMVEEAKAEIVSLVVAATEKILKEQADKSVTEKAIKKINNL
jgi:F-type H+-transporting ATPase subunit b